MTDRTKLIIELDEELDAEQLIQLQEACQHLNYNHHVELKWLWPSAGYALKAMTDRATVRKIELYKEKG